MEPRKEIEWFLQRVLDRRTRLYLAEGVYALLAYLVGGLLIAVLLANLIPTIRTLALPVAGLFGAGLFYLVFRFFIRGAFSRPSLDQVALITEKKHPQLNNSLINSAQLRHHLDGPLRAQPLSVAMIRELLARTVQMIRDIDPASIVRSNLLSRFRFLLFGTLGVLMILILAAPDFLARGMTQWLTPAPLTGLQTAEAPASPIPDPHKSGLSYSVSDLSLTFNYPAYTRLESKVVAPSDGAIHVLPGTEIRLNGQTNHPVAGADLVINGSDFFAMQTKEKTGLEGSFLVKEKGFYQFRLKGASGMKSLLPNKYPISLEQDQAPNIILFLANPKPIYFDNDKVQLFYEAKDDFGISGIDLVIHVKGKTIRKSVKHVKGAETSLQDSYTWPLSAMLFKPGDEVQYYLEIKDNDNVLGPNIGHSETYSFTVFDSNKEKENLIVLQEELTEKMIALLANNLVTSVTLTDAPVDLKEWKRVFSINVDDLIEIIRLTQRIRDRAESLEGFPQPYFNFLKNVITHLTRIRERQIDAMNHIQNSVLKPTPASFNPLVPHEINNKLIRHLEKDILFLVKMTNRQKLDRVVDLEKHLSELTESLREEFEKAKDTSQKPPPNEIRTHINQIKQTLQKIMDQLSRQTRGLPDEFLNPNSFKGLNMDQFAAALDRIQDLVNRGEIDQAMEELKKLTDDIKTLANQLDQENQEMDNLMDAELMKMIDDSIDRLDKLEQNQKELIEQTTQINQALRKAQSKKMEEEIESFFKSLKKDVRDIQAILQSDKDYLRNHPTMKRLNELLEEETRAQQNIQELGQKTVDSSLTEDLDKRFRELNQARKELTQLAEEMDSLRVRSFQKFNDELPELEERYAALEELADLSDLNEFNNLFKQTYPEVFRQQNRLRTTPNRKEDMADRLDADLREVTRLNGEISKKLGSLMRSIKEDYRNLVTQQNKKDLDSMAKNQGQMQEEAEKLSQRFARMNQQNPMITRELFGQMSRAGRQMERAGNHLKNFDVQESIDSENQALRNLQQTRDILDQLKDSNGQMRQNARRQSPQKLGTGSSRDPRRGGSVRMQKEKVLLPSEDQYRVPSEFREEILDAMKLGTPRDYQRMVMEYYKDLVK